MKIVLFRSLTMLASATKGWRGLVLEVVLVPRNRRWRTLISLDSRSSDLQCLEELWWRPSTSRRTSFQTDVFHGSWQLWLNRSWLWTVWPRREFSVFLRISTKWCVWRHVMIDGSQARVVTHTWPQLCSNSGYVSSIFRLTLVGCSQNKTKESDRCDWYGPKKNNRDKRCDYVLRRCQMFNWLQWVAKYL